MAGLMTTESLRASESGSLPETTLPAPAVRPLPSGPWGEIEVFDIFLEPPDSYTANSTAFNAWRNEIVWAFVASPNALPALLKSAGLNDRQVAKWTDRSRLQITPSGIEIRPTAEEILALAPENRARLYPKIQFARRYNPYRKPFPLKLGGFDQMAADSSGVSPASAGLIRRLTWRNGHIESFSDLSLVLKQAANDEERRRIHKTLMRELAVTARLKLSGQSDLRAITKYWSAGGRNQDFHPLLESVVQTRGVERIDVVHLLPPVPRKLLNTYSNSRMAVGDNLPDCFSTAFSFFADETNERFFDSIAPALLERYERATKPWQFGDVILIFETGNPKFFLHACNYVAGDLVFTKNGQNFGRPWKLAPLRSVFSDYLVADRITANFYRLKPAFRQ